MKMKVLLIFAILAIAQPLFATQSLNQCFEELGNELDEHEKSLENVGFVDQDYQQKDFFGEVIGLTQLVSTLLHRINDLLGTITGAVANILTILLSGKMGGGSKAILNKVFTKMTDLYDPFLEANKKVKLILEKLVNNHQF